uniref:UBA domain-containing protein n=1 Tax=Oryza nivara TaxID=4536 RepID=A0A0E0HRT1_ORYNI
MATPSTSPLQFSPTRNRVLLHPSRRSDPPAARRVSSHPRSSAPPARARARAARMDYDYRGRPGSGSYGGGVGGGGGSSSLYPRVGQPSHGVANAPPPQPPRAAPYHHHGPPTVSAAPHPVPAPSSTSMGIQVVIKPAYRITPPPQLPPQLTEIPRSTFNFDFEYERKILAEAEKENPNWSKFVIESQPPPPPQPPRGPKLTTPTTSVATPGDPVVDKYISMGLGREAVSFAVKEFVKSYNALHEMGFTSSNVPELLAIHDNDPDKVIQHLIGTS